MKFFRLYVRVLELLGPEARLGWALALAGVALASAGFVEPILFGRIVDALANAQGGSRQLDWGVLLPLVGAWVGFGLFIIVISTVVSLHADRLAHRHCQAVRADYFEHILQLPLSYHTGTHSGRLMKVMITGTNTLWGMWLSFFREHFTSFVSLFILMPLTLFLNWRYALLLMALCGVFALLIAFVLRRTENLQSTVETYYTDQAERTSDTLGNIALIQSFARIDMEVSAMRKVGTQLLGAQMPVLWWWALATVLTKASTTITMLAILVVGIFFYVRGETTVGEIVMFMSFATMLIGKLEQVVHFANHMVMEGPRLQEFFDVLDTTPAVHDRPDAVDPGRMRGLIEFKDVSYSYDGKRAAVQDLNFTALPGETIAMVGSTGAGKSTALALLHRVYDPQSGVVKIDGMDIRALTLSGLRKNIGVVFQEALLFNRSIADNLRVGKSDATDAELLDVLRRAQALDIVERNPQGIEATVGERGRMLSGGERQRVSIARALLKDPPILILDEATSALDALTEAKVQAALVEVMKGRTTFVIAHRLATIRNATRILVFEGGRIIESGSFDELVRFGGHFAELARTQFMVSEGARRSSADGTFSHCGGL
jgi:ATP-binding cassette, subfamily B, beta-glucan exporter